MNIDMAALHAIEPDKGSRSTSCWTRSTALLTATGTPTATSPTRASTSTASRGLVADGAGAGRGRGHRPRVGRHARGLRPHRRHHRAAGHRCSACATRSTSARAREFSAKEGDIVGGVIQRDARANARGRVVVDRQSAEGSRACCPPPSRCRASGLRPRRADPLLRRPASPAECAAT